MKAVFLNPFLAAGQRVLQDEFGLQVRMGQPALLRSDVTTMPVNVLINVVGKVQGIAMYAMETVVAKRLIHAMVGQEVSLLDELGESALAEMGNIITGLSATAMEAAGYPCNISPPAVTMGTGVRIFSTMAPMVVVPFHTDLGEIRIFLSLVERSA